MRRFQGMGLIAALAAMACSSGDPVDIGEEVTGERLEDYAASWDGYAEAYQFSDSSDRVRLVLDEAGTGTLEVGDSPPFLPATDPNVWPNPTDGDPLSPGFAYSVESQLEGARLRIGANDLEPYREWCELQTPVLDLGRYVCIPGFSRDDDGNYYYIDPVTEEPVYFDYSKRVACAACTCEADGCAIPSGFGPILDGVLEDKGNTLVGTLLLGDQGVTVRLQRVD